MNDDKIEGSGWVYKKKIEFSFWFVFLFLIVLLSLHSVNFLIQKKGVVSPSSECQNKSAAEWN